MRHEDKREKNKESMGEEKIDVEGEEENKMQKRSIMSQTKIRMLLRIKRLMMNP